MHLAGIQANWITARSEMHVKNCAIACTNMLRHMHSAHETKLIARQHVR